jgi:hypothetical protein
MTSGTNRLVHVDLDDKARGRVDRDRLGQPNRADVEERPRVTEQDAKATRAEVERRQRGLRRRAAE